MILTKLPRSFYDRNTILVAQELLGKYLVRLNNNIEQIGKIVEVEAYLGAHDLASHSSKGLTTRTKIMFGPPGQAYVYIIYGIYHCLNVVTEKEGYPAAVLIRALEPIKNISARTQGPGLLCRALEIDKAFNGYDLLSKDFYIAESTNENITRIIKRPRIGINYAGHWAKRLLRFYLAGNKFVSKL